MEGALSDDGSEDTRTEAISLGARMDELRLENIRTVPRVLLVNPLSRLSIGNFFKLDQLSNDFDYRTTFRFSKDELILQCRLLKFPEEIFTAKGCRFTGEEVFLAGYYRLASINRFGDLGWQQFFGFSQPRASMAWVLFEEHMIKNWSYLILDNMDFWAARIPEFARLIAEKANTLHGQDQAIFDPSIFRIFAFIDNTTFPTCRPGGGPRRDGHRHNPLIQEAFYNGWKKHHGLKFQTVDTPCGMNFDVFGPVSLRHSDIYTWHASRLSMKMAALLLRHSYPNYRIYGDSAYTVISDECIAYHVDNSTDRTQGPKNKAMNSCRESIEWNYGDVKGLFKMVDYPKALRLRQMPVGNMCLLAILLRNFHVCFYGCNTSTYFKCQPPTFEEYVANGPRLLG